MRYHSAKELLYRRMQDQMESLLLVTAWAFPIEILPVADRRSQMHAGAWPH